MIYIPAASTQIPAQDNGVYPDPINPSKQKSVFRKGDIYIRKVDESVKVEIPEDLLLLPVGGGPEMGLEEAREITQAYIDALKRGLASALPPLLPVSGPEEVGGQSLIQNLLAPKNFLLEGTSGSGKSVHLRHLCLAALTQNELPILIPAGRYRGEGLPLLLDYSVGPFCAKGSDSIVKAASICCLRLLLVIDGLNECQGHLEQLVGEVQAFRLRHRPRIVMASQTEIISGQDLALDRVQITPLTPLQKRFIYCFHAGMIPSTEVDFLCQGFSNAYDLAIAGRCHRRGNPVATRAELYDRYCREYLPADGATLLTALLRQFAGRMGQEITNFCSREEFERDAEGFLLVQKAPLLLLDQLKSSRLVNITDDSFAFEHDLLLDYFRAAHLSRVLPGFDSIISELAKPRNQPLIAFVLPRYKDPNEVRALFGATSNLDLFNNVLAGRCGELARRVLLDDCTTLLEAAGADLPQVTVSFTVGESGAVKRAAFPSFHGHRSWTPYETLLCDLIAANLDNPALQAGFLGLLDLTQWALRAKAHEAADQLGMPFNSLWQMVIGFLSLAVSTDVPFLRIAQCLRSNLMLIHRRATFTIRDPLLERVMRDPKDHFSLAILLEGMSHCTEEDPDFDLYVRLAQSAWETRIYHLRLLALDLIRSLRWTIRERHPEKLEPIRELLAQFDTRNLFVSSALVELLAAYGMLEAPVPVDNALQEMRTVIAEGHHGSGNGDKAELCERAYGLISRIFEDVFQGAFYDAYESLEPAEKVSILSLAAHAKYAEFFITWILSNLLEIGAESAPNIFHGFAASIHSDCHSPQEATSAYVIGIAGCSDFMNEPPTYTGPDTPEHLAWKIIGQILFWRFWRARDLQRADSRVEELWTLLGDNTAIATADVLYRLADTWLGYHFERAKEVNLITLFPKQVKLLLELSLRRRESLKSVFPWGGTRDDGLLRFVVATLGRIGNDGTIPLLMEISDDPKLGAVAVRAIQQIRESSRFNRSN